MVGIIALVPKGVRGFCEFFTATWTGHDVGGGGGGGEALLYFIGNIVAAMGKGIALRD